MSIDGEGFLLLILVSASIGFAIGWMGGVAEGRARATEEQAP